MKDVKIPIKYQHLLTMIKKEIWMYIISFSNFLVFAGVLAVLVFLFFNNFYAVNASNPDYLFSLFPWTFAVFVPAVTMGILAQERRDKTLNFLLASPLNETEIVVGKFLGAWAFLSMLPLITIVIPMSLSGVARFDWGTIAAAYGASVLLLGFFVATDMFVSSFFKNQLAAFILSFVANFFIILLGTDLLSSIFPPQIVHQVIQISPMEHFQNLSRGLIAASDLLYFVLSIIALLLLTIWQVMRLRLPQKRKILAYRSLPLHVLAVGLLIGSFLANYVPGNIDITQNKLFTLAEGTKNILTSLSDPVTIDVYLSKDLPPAFQPIVDDLDRLLDQLSTVGGSKVQINRKYPQGDEALTKEAAELGVTPQPFTVVSQTEYSAKEGYLGMNIKYKSNHQAVPFLTQNEQLEYQIMSMVYSLSRDTKPKVVFLSGSTEPQSMTLTDALSTAYSVGYATLNKKDDPTRLKKEELEGDVIIMTHPDGDIHPDDIALLVDKVNTGTSLIVLDSGAQLTPQGLTASSTGTIFVNELLKTWKAEILPGIVYDLKNPNVVGFNTASGQTALLYPMWPTVAINQDIPLLRDIGSLVVPWPSALNLQEGSELHPLLETTEYAGVASGETIDLTPSQNYNQDNLRKFVVGAMRSRGEKNGAVIVLPVAQLIEDSFIGRGNNLVFMGQIIDLASQGRDLASIRLKNRLPASLVFAEESQKVYIRYSNLIGLPLLVIVIGGVILYQRRKKTLRPYVPS